MQLDLLPSDGDFRAVSPILEMGAYETLWTAPGASFHKLAKRFERSPGSLPSDFVDHDRAMAMADRILQMVGKFSAQGFDVRIHGTAEYPVRLRDAKNPVELLYFQGWWSLVSTPCVAVVGTRSPTQEAAEETREIVRGLASDGWTIVSGLARGVDTVAHTEALHAAGKTIAVLGTSLCATYPRENAALQQRLARDHLVVSQVPFMHWQANDYRSNRRFFPERNHTMSALAAATIIIEASESSGTLIQAQGALRQGRKLLILDRCFKNASSTWPPRFEEKGAIRVRGLDEIRDVLSALDQD